MSAISAQVSGISSELNIRELKPKLRGWLHAGYTPLVLAASIVLVVLTPTGATTVAVILFGLTALSLFGTSAVYHIGNGRMHAAVTAVLKKVDHANIFLIIAGTYTPLSMLLLPASSARLILTLVWAGAIAGTMAHLLWKSAPRWIYAPIYVALGWVAVAFLRDFTHYGGFAIVALIIAGGVAYTVGAVIYAIKRPNPFPKWFGFHEIFHAFTMLGFAAHTVALFLAVT